MHGYPWRLTPRREGEEMSDLQGERIRPYIPRAMTIAGSDSGGGAGIQADLKTFTVLGVYGTSAIAALTAQNTLGVHGILTIYPDFVAAQIRAVLEDIGADAVKTGMLSNADVLAAVAEEMKRFGVRKLVVDPVMVSKSGHRLLQPEACEALKTRLLPLALVVTPNIPEAETLTGRSIASVDEMKRAAVEIASMGPSYVVMKGGHLDGPAVDLVYHDGEFTELSEERVISGNTHGTGCTFSAAIAAYLALGFEPPDAIRRAKTFVTCAIKHAGGIGRGCGPTNHLAWLNERR